MRVLWGDSEKKKLHKCKWNKRTWISGGHTNEEKKRKKLWLWSEKWHWEWCLWVEQVRKGMRDEMWWQDSIERNRNASTVKKAMKKETPTKEKGLREEDGRKGCFTTATTTVRGTAGTSDKKKKKTNRPVDCESQEWEEDWYVRVWHWMSEEKWKRWKWLNECVDDLGQAWHVCNKQNPKLSTNDNGGDEKGKKRGKNPGGKPSRQQK